MVTHRRTETELLRDADEGLERYRLTRRIPIMGVLHADGEPGFGHLEMFTHPIEDVLVEVIVNDGEAVATFVDTVPHADVPVAGAIKVETGAIDMDMVHQEAATGLLVDRERAKRLIVEIMRPVD